MKNQPVAEASTSTTHKIHRDKHPCPQQNLNPQSKRVAADRCLILHSHQDQQHFTSKLTNFRDQRFDESQPDQMNIVFLVALNNLY